MRVTPSLHHARANSLHFNGIPQHRSRRAREVAALFAKSRKNSRDEKISRARIACFPRISAGVHIAQGECIVSEGRPMLRIQRGVDGVSAVFTLSGRIRGEDLPDLLQVLETESGSRIVMDL